MCELLSPLGFASANSRARDTESHVFRASLEPGAAPSALHKCAPGTVPAVRGRAGVGSPGYCLQALGRGRRDSLARPAGGGPAELESELGLQALELVSAL